MTTLKGIAEACGVSVATVSKALNNAPDIGAATGDRIRRAAREMGYYPNAAARTLKTNRTYNIGVLFEDDTHAGLTHEYFSHVLNALKNGVESRGYDVTFISKNTGSAQMSFLEHCKYRGYDGVAITNVDFDDPAVAELLRIDIPVVIIDHLFPERSSVLSDNVKGMEDLVEHVYNMGHRRIAFIHGEDTAVTRLRMEGFSRACRRLSLDIPSEYIHTSRFHDLDGSARATRALLALDTPPTCILYPDDISLMGGMSAIEAAGLRIPDDISIAGYDGITLGQLMRPQVTTLYQDSTRLGSETARLLAEAIETPQTYRPQVVSVPGRVLPGGTVRAV